MIHLRDTPNSGIFNIAPNEVEKYTQNIDKLQIMNHQYDLEIGRIGFLLK